MTQFSGVMHCWLAAKVEVGGETYICLRGINWRGEYDPSVAPRWHVPTSKFTFDVDREPPSKDEVVKTIMPIVMQEWPALGKAELVGAVQDLSGNWGGNWVSGGITNDGKIEAVTSLAFNFGIQSELPSVVLKPTAKLPWPRQPVTWIKANDVRCYPAGKGSICIVHGAHRVTMETPEKAQDMIASDLELQSSVAFAFSTFKENFFQIAPLPPVGSFIEQLAKAGRLVPGVK